MITGQGGKYDIVIGYNIFFPQMGSKHGQSSMLGMESNPGENFLSFQYKDRGGGSLEIFVCKDSDS